MVPKIPAPGYTLYNDPSPHPQLKCDGTCEYADNTQRIRLCSGKGGHFTDVLIIRFNQEVASCKRKIILYGIDLIR